MNTFGSIKTNGINRRNILGGIPDSYEDGFEREVSVVSTIASAIASGAKDVFGGVYEATVDLSKTVVIAESKTESKGNGKFPTPGSIEFKNNQAQAEQLQKQQAQFEELKKQKVETDRKKAFFQTLKENQERTEREKEKLLLEEINDIALNLPTEQKNQLLHYQAAYRDRSIYQLSELRKKLIEQRRQEERKQKETSIPNPAKQPSAMEGAFEGRMGTQGSGQANLSAQAVG